VRLVGSRPAAARGTHGALRVPPHLWRHLAPQLLQCLTPLLRLPLPPGLLLLPQRCPGRCLLLAVLCTLPADGSRRGCRSGRLDGSSLLCLVLPVLC
jgi:hypothetical protein